jgi:hypothetical protein
MVLKIPFKKKVKWKYGKTSPIYIPNQEYHLTNWVPPRDKILNILSIYANAPDKEFIPQKETIPSHSWFDITRCANLDAIKPNQYVTQAPIIPPESMKYQLAAIKKLKKNDQGLNKEPVFFAAKKIRLYPTEEQKIILHQWFDLCTNMNNITVDYVRKNICKKGFDPKTARKLLIFSKIRKALYDKKQTIQQSMGMGNSSAVNSFICNETINTCSVFVLKTFLFMAYPFNHFIRLFIFFLNIFLL